MSKRNDTTQSKPVNGQASIAAGGGVPFQGGHLPAAAAALSDTRIPEGYQLASIKGLNEVRYLIAVLHSALDAFDLLDDGTQTSPTHLIKPLFYTCDKLVDKFEDSVGAFEYVRSLSDLETH